MIGSSLRGIGRGLRNALSLAARPVKKAGASGKLVVQPYRGYGTSEEIYFMGRVFRQPGFGTGLRDGSILRDVTDVIRRFVRWGLGDAMLIARFAGNETTVRTDRDGYFHVHMHLERPLKSDRLWHEIDLEVDALGTTVRDTADVFIPPESSRFVVVSDIDDTVMFTGVVNKAKMMWRLFVQGAESRLAFPGVGALYRALHAGKSGKDKNPMLYVSRGPWSIYEVLDRFFNIQDIPVGPVLFLREWGLTIQRPLPKRAKGHKLDLLEDMLSRYQDLPFVLIGDSGQHDPEIYAKVVHEHPDRIRAVYIRNVSRDDARVAEIEELAEEVSRTGSHLVLAADSFVMAEHAAEIGLIEREALTDVLQERIEQEGRADVKPRQEVRAGAEPVSERVRDSVDEGEGHSPPSVVVRPGARGG